MGEYLKLFKNHKEYKQYISGEVEELPKISHCIQEIELHITDYKESYLTFVALEDGTFTLTIGSSVTTSLLESVSYSTDFGETWVTTNNIDGETVTITTPTINANKRVFWKGEGVAMSSAISTSPMEDRAHLSSIFTSSGEFNIEGNIMSLLYGDNFKDATEFAEGSSSNFGYLFYQHNTVDKAKVVSCKNMVLPALIATDSCYVRMFQTCETLIEPPKEIAPTTLGFESCSSMFLRCYNMATVPKLPCLTLGDGCYAAMFRMCHSLAKAPELPATILVENCYEQMFDECISLVEAPYLQATHMEKECYRGMFVSCTNLKKVQDELPATTLAYYCYYGMFAGCALTKAPALPATILAEGCYYNMFLECTSLTKAPVLPAITLVKDCYKQMFADCTSLNYVKAMFTTTPSNTYTPVWLDNVAANGTFVKNSAATWTNRGSNAVPNGWTIETASK